MEVNQADTYNLNRLRKKRKINKVLEVMPLMQSKSSGIKICNDKREDGAEENDPLFLVGQSQIEPQQGICVESRFHSIVLPINTVPLSNHDADIDIIHTNVDANTNIVTDAAPTIFNTMRKFKMEGSDNSDNSDEENRKTEKFAGFQTVINTDQKIRKLLNDLLIENKDILEQAVPNLNQAYSHDHNNSNCECSQIKSYTENAIVQMKSGVLNSENNIYFLMLYAHSFMCESRKNGWHCPVPLCGSIESSLKDILGEHENFLGQNEEFHCVYQNGMFNQRIDLDLFWAKPIGKGGFGTVYESWLNINNKSVRAAVKKVPLISEKNGRDLSEFLKLSNLLPFLNGPHVLAPCMLMHSQNYLLSVMQIGAMCMDKYLQSLLASHINEEKCCNFLHFECEKAGLTMPQFMLYYRQMCEGVKFLHDNNLFHGDIKPANMLIMPDGVLKLCDLDSVRVYKPAEQVLCGTPGFAAPEVYKNGTQPISDVFSLASCVPCLLGLFDMTYLPKTGPEETVKRNELLSKKMGTVQQILPFAALFQWGTTPSETTRPNINTFTEFFYRHGAFNEYRRLGTEMITVTEFHPDSRDADIVVRNWMRNNFPDME